MIHKERQKVARAANPMTAWPRRAAKKVIGSFHAEALAQALRHIVSAFDL